MTPAEHYAEAERLLSAIENAEHDLEAQYLSAQAQVHATLAMAPIPEPPARAVLLTAQEKGVLRDAIRSDREIRNDTGVRASLLRSASEKLGLEL